MLRMKSITQFRKGIKYSNDEITEIYNNLSKISSGEGITKADL